VIFSVLIIVIAIAGVVLVLTQAMGNDSGIPSVGTLNASQLTILAQNAGFTGSDLATAVAVALAESGGNTQAYNPETAAGAAQGKGSYGLWQIYLTAHPQYTAAQLLDPQTNANAAYSVYVTAGYAFTPWSTYNSSAYLAFSTQANAATGQQVS
jgi:hypothetical protein